MAAPILGNYHITGGLRLLRFLCLLVWCSQCCGSGGVEFSGPSSMPAACMVQELPSQSEP